MDKQELDSEANVGIYISTFLGTVALFFAGILISRLQNFDSSLKIPILYLIVATFGFVFSAVIYANMVGAKRLERKAEQSYIRLGNVISEYLGLYLFIAAIPMVVNAVTTDSFLRLTTLLVTMISLALYSVSPFSIARRGFSRAALVIFTLFVTLSLVAAAVLQHHDALLKANGALFIVVLSLTAILHRNKV